MKKNILILAIILIILSIASLFIYLNFFKKNKFKEEVKVEEVNLSTSYISFNNHSLEIHSNLLDENQKITIEGIKKGNDYSINKIYFNFKSDKEKELFTINKLYKNSFLNSFSSNLELDNDTTIFAIIPLKIKNQEYVDMIPVEEVYKYVTNNYAPPISPEKELTIKLKNDVNVVDISYYENDKKTEIEYNQDNNIISFKKENQRYYSIKIETKQDLLEFIII